LSAADEIQKADPEPKVEVLVGYTPAQPPFAVDARGNGLVTNLLAAMSKHSSIYSFKARALYAQRASQALSDGILDIIAFQNKNWGYDVPGVEQSLVLVKDRGAYFQLPGNAVQIGEGLLGATRGFHYAFADYSSEKLATMSNVLLAVNEQDVVNLVLRRRVDYGVASESLLKWHAWHSREKGGPMLEVLEETDTYVERMFVILPASKISKQHLNQLLLELQEQGKLAEMFTSYGLEVPPLSAPVPYPIISE
jgi:ABC-type amino acid transport substrate-binding protein